MPLGAKQLSETWICRVICKASLCIDLLQAGRISPYAYSVFTTFSPALAISQTFSDLGSIVYPAHLVPMASQQESGNISLEEVKELVNRCSLYDLDTHSFHDDEVGTFSFLDFPVFDMSVDKGVVKCFIDVVFDVPGPIPKIELKELLMSRSPLSDLPAPYGMKKELPVRCQFDLAVMPQADGDKFYVMKMFNFKEKLKTSDAASVCFGKPRMIDWTGEVRTMRKVIHYMFAHMGGFQCRHHVLRSHEEGKPEKERKPDEWDFGFDYIEEKGPRDNTRNRQLRWVTIETNNPDSPLYKWPSALVEKSLRNLSNDGVLAMVHEQWPLTLFDIDNRILRALAPLIPTLSEKAIGLHGEPGAGKTPLARTIAMAVSRHCIEKARKADDITPSFRQACEFDFFRGQAGSVFRPDIFDDGTLSEQQFKKLKAFTDVGNVESMSKERWGAAKWMKGQLRIYCVNDFDAAREPADDVPVLAKRAGQPSYVTHADFMKMLDVAWFQKENTESNIMAVLKRTHLMVNTKTFFYVRPASEKKQPVLRVPFGDKVDFLVEDSRTKYDFYRKGGDDLPPHFDRDVQWEARWMKAAMQGKPVDELPQRQIIRGQSLFFQEPTTPAANQSYSEEKIATDLAENMGASPTIYPASTLLSPREEPGAATTSPHDSVQPAASPIISGQPDPASEPKTPPSHGHGPGLSRQSTFARLRSVQMHVIDISDSPVKPVPSESKRPRMEVKQEMEETSSHYNGHCSDFNDPEGELAMETESLLAAEAEKLEEDDGLEDALAELMVNEGVIVMSEGGMDVEENEEIDEPEEKESGDVKRAETSEVDESQA